MLDDTLTRLATARTLAGRCWRDLRLYRGCATATPLPAVTLAGWNPWFVAPAIAPFFEVCQPHELCHRLAVKLWHSQHDRFDTGEGEVFLLQSRSYAVKTAMDSVDDLLFLVAVGDAEYVAELVDRPHEIARAVTGFWFQRNQGNGAEAYPLGVAGWAGTMSFHQPERLYSLENHLKLPSE